MAQHRGRASVDGKREELRNKALEQAVAVTTAKGSVLRQVHASDLAAEMLRVFKGPGGLARRIYIQFLKAPNGSHTRTKILDMVAKFVLADSAHNNAPGTQITDMDDAEIEREMEQMIGGAREGDAGDPDQAEAIELEERIIADEMEDPEIAEMESEIAAMESKEDDNGDIIVVPDEDESARSISNLVGRLDSKLRKNRRK
jgi:hypothetical protein